MSRMGASRRMQLDTSASGSIALAALAAAEVAATGTVPPLTPEGDGAPEADGPAG